MNYTIDRDERLIRIQGSGLRMLELESDDRFEPTFRIFEDIEEAWRWLRE